MLLAFHPFQSNAATTKATATVTVSKSANEAEAAQAKVLMLRLNEINAMDKSTLNSSEKKNLRNEVRSIKDQLKDLGDGIYISVGAVIIILLLLIILL